MTSYGDERQQYHRHPQQFHTLCEGRRLLCQRFLLHGRQSEQQHRGGAHHQEDEEQHAPTKTCRRNGADGSTHGQIWRKQRGDGLHKLTERQCGTEILTASNGCHKRVERRLHDGITDAKQTECNSHSKETIVEQRQHQSHDSQRK